MVPRHVAVIDIGKTNAKVVLVDLSAGSEAAIRRTPNPVARDGPYPHYGVEGLWSFVLDSLKALRAEGPIDAISVTTHGAAAALLTAAGDLALPILDYEYRGIDETADAYDRVRPDFAETGSPRLPAGLNLGAQFFWLQRTFPEAFAKTAAIVTYPQYWSWRLAGVASTEVTSLGCHTDLWNPVRRDYSALVDRMDWRARMAPLRRAGDTLGPIRREVADATGIDRACPVICGIHDSNASLLPHLIREERPFSVVSSGTWMIAMAVGGSEPALDPRRDTLINVDAFGEPVRSARFMGGREHERVMGDRAIRYTERELASVLERKIMLFPPVEPGTGPFPDRAGGWSVPPETLSDGERAAGAACYLALMTATCLDMIGAQGPTLVEGAFARDPHLMGLLATVTGRDVRRQDTRTTGTSIGAAILAGPGPAGADAQQVSAPPFSRLSGLIRLYARQWSEAVQALPRKEA